MHPMIAALIAYPLCILVGIAVWYIFDICPDSYEKSFWSFVALGMVIGIAGGFTMCLMEVL